MDSTKSGRIHLIARTYEVCATTVSIAKRIDDGKTDRHRHLREEEGLVSAISTVMCMYDLWTYSSLDTMIIDMLSTVNDAAVTIPSLAR